MSEMSFSELVEQFTNPLRAASRRAFKQSQVGGPSNPDVVANSLLAMSAGIRNRFDFSHSATDNHREFRSFAEPLVESFANRINIHPGGVYIDYEGSSSENRVVGSHVYRIGSDKKTRGDGIVYDVWIQNDAGVANIYAKTAQA